MTSAEKQRALMSAAKISSSPGLNRPRQQFDLAHSLSHYRITQRT